MTEGLPKQKTLTSSYDLVSGNPSISHYTNNYFSFYFKYMLNRYRLSRLGCETFLCYLALDKHWLKLYCGCKYTRPCIINRIWGLKQLLLQVNGHT